MGMNNTGITRHIIRESIVLNEENSLTPMEIEFHINNNFGKKTKSEEKLNRVNDIIKSGICMPEAEKILENYRTNLCASMILD